MWDAGRSPAPASLVYPLHFKFSISSSRRPDLPLELLWLACTRGVSPAEERRGRAGQGRAGGWAGAAEQSSHTRLNACMVFFRVRGRWGVDVLTVGVFCSTQHIDREPSRERNESPLDPKVTTDAARSRSAILTAIR